MLAFISKKTPNAALNPLLCTLESCFILPVKVVFLNREFLLR